MDAKKDNLSPYPPSGADPKRHKVLCALSGGVDSASAALLLKREGFGLLGATMRLLTGETVDAKGLRTCCSLSDIEDARDAAKRLDIDFLVFNFSLMFEEEVIRRFAASYKTGLTPNPCILCNRHMKFFHLWDRAKTLDCDYIATGHYARVERLGDRFLLKKALDPLKDQSYVLYNLSQEELSRTLFPLGGLTKEEVRKIALKAGLNNAQKPESQDICFVPDGDYGAFLERYLPSPPGEGDIVNREGKVLGRHKGVHRHTVGQRRGLNIPYEKPLYVLEIDPVKNLVIAGPREELLQSSMIVGDLNYVAIPSLASSLSLKVKIRYRQTETPCEASPLPDGRVMVLFASPQEAVAPGQSAVFYDGDSVVMGGVIQRSQV
jgi:tRNA-specific 2-thiouridylase